MLRQRIISGTLLAALVIALLCLDGYLAEAGIGPWRVPGTEIDLAHWLTNGALCTLTALVLTWLAAAEVSAFVRAAGYVAYETSAKLFAAGLVIGPYISFNLKPLTGWYDESWGMAWLALVLGWAFFLQAVRRGTANALLNLAATVFVVYYTGGLAGFFTKLRMEVGGATGVAVLLFSMFIVKMTDVGAFFIGRLLGRRKLIEWLSPQKTWEGFFGGLVVAVACSLGVGHWLHASGLTPFETGGAGHLVYLAVFGLLMGVFSVAGDLCASLLKRDAAVKDSSDLIPGMGGVLDILDSPLLAAPVAWFFWTRVVRVVAES